MTDFVMRAAELLGAVIKEQTESIRAERDAACADRDKAVREAQALRERVQGLELKLLEVREIVASLQVSTTSTVEAEVGGFRVGDLVRNLPASDRAWGTVKHLGRFVEVEYADLPHRIAYAPAELARKSPEVGDAVRVVCGHLKDRKGVVEYACGGEQMRVKSFDGSFYATAAHLVAVAA